MMDRLPINEDELQARAELVALAQAMLQQKLSFLEGSVLVLQLKSKSGGISDHDPDFLAFVGIGSETDHLPLQAKQHLWRQDALAHLEPELRSAEEWASSVGSAACLSLVARFGMAEERAA